MEAFLHSIGYDNWVLPALLLIPVIGAVLLLLMGRGARDGDDSSNRSVRLVAFSVLLIEFLVSLGLWWTFDPASAAWQSSIDREWIPMWGIRFTLGIDGIALMMILLTTFIMPLCVLGSWTSIKKKVSTFFALMLILTSGMLGVFMSRDLFLFYVMWEVMLVPMYFIIGIWGGERRIYASIKFFIYTMLPSLLMLVAILYLGVHAGSNGTPNFSYDNLLTHSTFAPRTALWLFGAFFAAFAVKVPMFPFHTWLPDAHVEAPTAGSVVLAGIMLKMGTFGFLRFALPLQSVQGALMIMINHGISTGALFLLIGIIYERKHSRAIAAYGGIARVVPLFAALLTLVSLSSIGLPGTNGFVGEFLVLVGSFKPYPVATTIAATGVIFAAAYLLWAIQRILFNKLDKPENEHIPDLNWREVALIAPLIAVIIWLGVYPAPVLRRMETASQALVTRVQTQSSPSVSLSLSRERSPSATRAPEGRP